MWFFFLPEEVELLKEKKPELSLFILDNSISSKLFFLEVQLGSPLIDAVLLQEGTLTKSTVPLYSFNTMYLHYSKLSL